MSSRNGTVSFFFLIYIPLTSLSYLLEVPVLHSLIVLTYWRRPSLPRSQFFGENIQYFTIKYNISCRIFCRCFSSSWGSSPLLLFFWAFLSWMDVEFFKMFFSRSVIMIMWSFFLNLLVWQNPLIYFKILSFTSLEETILYHGK